MQRFRNSQYLIDETGIIYNEKTKRNSKPYLKTFKKGNKYYCLSLTINGKPKSFLYHRILAELFIPNPNNLPQVNHIDGNGLNNSLNNLEWCTQQYNNIHAIETGLRPTKINRKIAETIRIEALYQTKEELALKYNMSTSYIYKIINRYKWK